MTLNGNDFALIYELHHQHHMVGGVAVLDVHQGGGVISETLMSVYQYENEWL